MKDEKIMPWRSEELGDIIGDNLEHDEKKRSDNPSCPCKCHVHPIGCQHCKPLNDTRVA